MSSPVHYYRHQALLENIFDSSSRLPVPLTPAERAQARSTFARIVDHFEQIDNARGPNSNTRGVGYSQPRLIRCTYEFALSEESQDIFLRSFFSSMALSIDDNTELDFQELAPLFSGFAEYLIDNFFLPLKASTGRTPQPSPAYHSAVLRAQSGGAQAFVGTPERLSSLRGACLVRDRFRCVISRRFSVDEWMQRLAKDGSDARDDDGNLLLEENQGLFDRLEVAHILPHSLMKANSNAVLDKSREAALAILNMFDYGISHMIDGADIDRPRNALTLSAISHTLFGSFKVFFTSVHGEYNTYHIQSFLPPAGTAQICIPVTRTLFGTETRTIDPPSPRLLAVHRAIAHILHLSGAGLYIDRVLRDIEDNVVRSDGTSDLARMVSLGLGGWLDGAVYS